MTKSRLKWALKALITIVLIWFVVARVGGEALADRLLVADREILALTLPIAASFLLAGAMRWWLVCTAIGMPIGFQLAQHAFAVAYFFNQTLPSTIGGDAYRIWAVGRAGHPTSRAVRAVLVDRLVGLQALTLVVVAGLPSLYRLADDKRIALGIAAAAVVGLAISAAVPLMSSLRFLHGRWLGFVAELASDARAVLGRVRVGLPALALSGMVFVLYATVAYLVARAIEAPLPFTDALVLVPPVILVTVLPISFAGWGIREITMGITLGWIGVPSIDAVAISVGTGFVLLATGLPGGLLWLLGRRG